MKQLSCIDHIDNLRALIRHDLRELGIKVPKPKKSKRGGPKVQQDANRSVIFGNYLAHVHCVHVVDCGYVAKFLVDAADIILANADSEGIFRKSGAVSRQKEIKQQLECGKGFVGANVHDVTALVKQFFRELPEPLFTSSYHDTFIRCFQLENQESATKAVLLLCLMLPGEHVSTLRFILLLLSKIALQSDKNKMDSTNLAVVLAPNLMHVNSKSETMKSCEEKLLQTSVVELLINNAHLVGMVDDNLAGRTALMSEVFSTDDELDGSEDNLEDTKETKRKDKKRKRSGSFQGFVTSITQFGQSITKWRRSTDGKTNTSSLSQGSNLSLASQGKTGADPPEDVNSQNHVTHSAMSDFTPVVRRKKSINAGTSSAFSASKKKAIIQNLPQHATLASTPFTPASTIKKMDINSTKRRVGKDTPSMPPRPYQITPRHSMKTPRKKLTLFSPASSLKKKRYSSTNNLSVPSPGKKSKGRGIFRRLSGSKGDIKEAFTDSSTVPAASQSHQIGQRLASPTSTPNSSLLETSDVHPKSSNQPVSDESPIAAILQNSYTASVCEQSVMSVNDERASLNEGFIALDDKDDVDMSCMMSEPDLSRCHDVEGEYVCLENMPRQTVSDTSVNISDKSRGHNRSFSADGVLDGSLKKSGLRRGQPNSVKAGLCHGSEKEVQKLRRSFGLDKSDIGYPIPVSVPDVTGSDLKALNQSVMSIDSGNLPCETVSCVSMEVSSSIQSEASSSIAPCDSVSCTDIRDITGMDTDSVPCNISGRESESGFSTISGGTAIFKPKQPDTDPNLDAKVIVVAESSVNNDKKTLVDQKYESVDSLFSEVSSFSPPSSNQREMTRSISADSGKGSICGESFNDSVNVTLQESLSFGKNNNKIEANAICEPSKISNADMLSESDKVSSSNKDESLESDSVKLFSTGCESVADASTAEPKPNFAAQKSRSTHDLHEQQEIVKTPGVARSKSLLDNTVARKNNGKPNLQISAETHKLLARAGYIRDQKNDKAKEKEDFEFPGNMNIPLIKQAEIVNPRRESLIALQKNKAGFVKSNVRQIEKISEETEDITEKYASPFRFPNSTTRKRGMSPLKIPVGLSKTETESFIQTDEKLSFGTARLPISTQLIKPSDPVVQMEKDNNVSFNMSGPLKRKPSIYYAKREVEDSINLKFKTSVDSKVNRDNSSGINQSIENTTMEIDDTNNEIDNQNELESLTTKGLFDGQSIDLNKSLEETINLVCTPMSEKLIQNQDRIPKSNKENTVKTSRKMPDVKPPLTTPLTVDNVTLRTGSGKTPVEVLKTSKSPCSPVKPLKRLGSPASPRCRIVRSPKMLKNRRHLLSAIPNPHEEELNNL